MPGDLEVDSVMAFAMYGIWLVVKEKPNRFLQEIPSLGFLIAR